VKLQLSVDSENDDNGTREKVVKVKCVLPAFVVDLDVLGLASAGILVALEDVVEDPAAGAFLTSLCNLFGGLRQRAGRRQSRCPD